MNDLGPTAAESEIAALRAERDAALAREAAMAEVLQLINANPGNLTPVFDALLEKAMRLIGAAFGVLTLFEGEHHSPVARFNLPERFAAFLRGRLFMVPNSSLWRLSRGETVIQIADIAADTTMIAADHARRMLAEEGGARTVMWLALRKGDDTLGAIVVFRREVRLFSAQEISVLQSFAAQAVIAMENARLLGELRERTAELAERNDAYGRQVVHQSAAIDVLQAMSASPGDPQPIFELIAQRAQEVCDGEAVAVFQFDGSLIHLRSIAASRDEDDRTQGIRRAYPMPPSRVTTAGRVILDRRMLHVRDMEADPDIHPALRALGYRSQIAMPLLRGEEPVGAIVLNARRPGGFSDSQVELIRTFAEQAVIAIDSAATYRALQQRTEELAARNSDFAERIDHQAATIDVLKEMSASPGDPQPVFELIVEQARGLCNGTGAVLFEYDGTHLHMRANAKSTQVDEGAFAAYAAQFPIIPTRGSITCRAILDRRIIHVPDTHADPEVSPMVRALGRYAQLCVPLMRDDAPIGVLTLQGEVGDFSDSQVALLNTFAEQAVIAITSAETYRALQDRTAELSAQNAHQGATIDVLKVMSSATGDTQPVFDIILRRAIELCGAMFGAVMETDGSTVHLRAMVGWSQELCDSYRLLYPRPLAPDWLMDRAMLAGRLEYVPDIRVGRSGRPKQVRDLDFRAQITLPLIRDGVVVGCIVVAHRDVGGFTPPQIALLETFGEQAVIAMGSAANFRALQDRTAELAARNSDFAERIEHQSATIDVLKLMSASPGDPQPVFDLIVARARRVCRAPAAALFIHDAGMIHLRAVDGLAEATRSDDPFGSFRALFPMPPDERFLAGRSVLQGRIVHARDVGAESGLFPEIYAAGHGSSLSVPMVRDGEVLGVVTLSAREKGGFSDSQVELLRTFAEQAVIAIASATTYLALQERTEELAARNSDFAERIEHQAATIDVLKVMSASPGDPQPVFDLIAERARLVCRAPSAAVFIHEAGMIHLRAAQGAAEVTGGEDHFVRFRSLFPMPPNERSLVARAVLHGRIVHARDVGAEPDLFPEVYAAGHGSSLSVPMLRDGEVLGTVTLSARETGGFTDSQVALLHTFAEQAVIATTSAETYRALQDRTAELTRSVAELQALEEVLRAVNASLDLDTVLDTIISRAVRLSRADEGSVYEYDTAEAAFRLKAAFGMPEDRVVALRDRRIRLGETHIGRAAVLREPVHVSDIQADPSLSEEAKEVLRGVHAVLAVPLLREETVVGGLVIRRRSAGDFAPETVALLQTFAAQSVLAIENARLFQEAGRARAAAEVALSDLHRTQDRLVHTEKMASLGQLTAGIAHEIKNPLNFVNNFAALSAELLGELDEALAPVALPAPHRADLDELTSMLRGNLEKVVQHGRRADGIVRNMLQHSRTGSAEQGRVDLNALAEEALNLAYHGARAEYPGFNITLERDFAPGLGAVTVYPQDLTRVLLNLIGNGFYAARKRAAAEPDLAPVLRLSTHDLGDRIEIRVRDNGTGMDAATQARIFEPFFTTKPTGEGTGLGLSLSHDIVVKQHGGAIAVESAPGAFSEFVVTLPRRQ